MKTSIKEVGVYLKSALLLTLALGLALIFVLKPALISASVTDALSLCAKAVVPSLFPFLVLSSFIVKSGLVTIIGRLMSPFTKFFFNLPGICATTLLMGLIGGFPVGPSMAADLYKNKLVTQRQAQVMCLFCINAGPAFVIGTVGFSILGSIRAGIVLYASMLLSSLFFGLIICQRLKVNEEYLVNRNDRPSVGKALCDSVTAGTMSMINICAYIIIFSAVAAASSIFITSSSVFKYTAVLLEVTRGLSLLAGEPLPLMSALLSFCGLCVHAQVSDSLSLVGLSYGKFFFSRLCCAGLSFLLCRTALFLFPIEYSVFSNMSSNLSMDFSMSAFACISTLLMSILLILDLDIPSELC